MPIYVGNGGPQAATAPVLTITLNDEVAHVGHVVTAYQAAVPNASAAR
ncbi:MAG: hypothetical protein R3C15_14700 [Thermoleophilia bacterium]